MLPTILLVEDSPDDVLFLRRAFVRAGVQVELQVAEDGRRAIDYLSGNGSYANRASHPIPRLVLLDLKIPHIPGLDVLRWIRAEPFLQAMTVVVLTSSDHPTDIKEAYARGANSFLSKPANPEDLVGLVKTVADYWLTRNVPNRG